MKYDNFEFFINIGKDQKRLAEYDTVINAEEREITSWIASEVNKKFTIGGRNESVSQAMRCFVELDGRLVDRTTWWPGCSGYINGLTVQADKMRPFIFSQVALSEDGALFRKDSPELDALGTIRIKLYRVTITKEIPWKDGDPILFNDIGPLHERTKLIGTHCASLGQTTRTQPTTVRILSDQVDPLDKPYCTFVFRHCPKEILEDRGVVVGLPSDVPASHESVTGASESTRVTSIKRQRSDDEIEESEVNEELDELDPSEDENEDEEALQTELDSITARIAVVKAKLSKLRAERSTKRVKRESM